MKPTLDSTFWQRALLAFTVGLFLSCAAKSSFGQAVDRSVPPAADPAVPLHLPRIVMRHLDRRRVPRVGQFGASAAVVTPKTDGAVMEMMRELRDVRDSLPLDYYDAITARYQGVAAADVQRAARRDIHPHHMVIVAVGDRQVIEPGLRAANIAPIVVVDASAHPNTGGTSAP